MSRSIPPVLAGSFGIGPALLPFIGTHGIAPFALGAAMLLLAAIPILLARRTAPAPETARSHSVFSVLRLAPAAFAAAFVFGALDAGMVGLLPVYAIRSGYTEAHAALIVTAIAVGSVLFQYPIGWLADRMDRRRLLVRLRAGGVAGAALAPFAVGTPVLFYVLVAALGRVGARHLHRGPDACWASASAAPTWPTPMRATSSATAWGCWLGPAAEGAALDAWNPHGLVAVLAAISAVYVAFCC